MHIHVFPFSGTYSVQFAKFDYLINSVNATCIFAINAPASACWIVFINSSLGLTFDGLIQHSLHQPAGLIPVPKTVLQHELLQELGKVVFDAKVYDMNMNENGADLDYPAFEQEEALVIEAMPPSPDHSPSIIGNKYLVSLSTDVIFQPTSPVGLNCK